MYRVFRVSAFAAHIVQIDGVTALAEVTVKVTADTVYSTRIVNRRPNRPASAAYEFESGFSTVTFTTKPVRSDVGPVAEPVPAGPVPVYEPTLGRSPTFVPGVLRGVVVAVNDVAMKPESEVWHVASRGVNRPYGVIEVLFYGTSVPVPRVGNVP